MHAAHVSEGRRESHLLCESKVISRLFFQLLMPSSWAWVSVSQSENCCTRNSSTCKGGGQGVGELV